MGLRSGRAVPRPVQGELPLATNEAFRQGAPGALPKRFSVEYALAQRILTCRLDRTHGVYCGVVDELLSVQSESVGRFLRRWYGTAENVLDVSLDVSPYAPAELVQWHTEAALTGGRVTFQDRPVAPRELAPDPHGMLVFWVENQNGYFWAVDLADDRLRVFSRETAAGSWTGSGELLGDFLLHCTVREAVIGGASKFTTFVDASEVKEALESFEPLKFVALDSEEPQVKLWCSKDALVRMAPPPTGYEGPGEQLWMLTFAAPSDSHIEPYASRFGLTVLPEAAPARAELPYEPPPF